MNRATAINLLLLGLFAAGSAVGDEIVVSDRLVHLRSGAHPEWSEYADKEPVGSQLELEFQARAMASESTLFVEQDDVRHNWNVELNGQRLGRLHLMEAYLTEVFPIPGGTLRDGRNQLRILPPSENDDVFIGKITVDPRSADDAVGGCELTVVVSDEDSGSRIPCRLTITDERGVLAALRSRDAAVAASLAIRPGVVYTGSGSADLSLRPGRYLVHATRGPTYGVATQAIELVTGQSPMRIDLGIRREVDTSGWVSSDTHLHTFTHSRHGDATVEERMLTIAGEGIELPVSTDHNLHIPYDDPADAMGVATYFKPITGNEVTTTRGHFNVFPMDPGERVPDFRVTNWPRLMEIFRATPGLKVVVLNHPRNIHHGFQPFAATNFNAVTGENLLGFEFSFDAMEVLNSSAQQSDYMLVYRDWFALLNHGRRIVAVGSSDGHDVSRYIVGQGRTYIQNDDDGDGGSSVDGWLNHLLAGRALVSMGLFVNLTVDEQFRVGDLAVDTGEILSVRVDVGSPAWMSATNVSLFANGVKIRQRELTGGASESRAVVIEWEIPKPRHDVHLVAMATGPGIDAPYWAIPRPYQPSSTDWVGRVIGSTNPIWVDADGDGRFTASREYARQIVDGHADSLSMVVSVLNEYDETVAAQAVSLLRAAGVDLRSNDAVEAFNAGSDAVNRGLAAYLATLQLD